MTANVAQAIVDAEAWRATLRGVHRALRPGGHLVLEMRDPAYGAWRGWTRAQTYRTADVPGIGVVEGGEESATSAGRWSPSPALACSTPTGRC